MALTAHFDATNNGNVYEDSGGTNPTEDGDSVLNWQDEGDLDLALYAPIAAPIYHINTPLMLHNCVAFNGTTQSLGFYTQAIAARPMSTFLGASAKTIIMALYIEGFTLNDAEPYNNDMTLGDVFNFFGIYLKNSTPKKIIAYNWDGNADAVEFNVSPATTYIVAVRHNGTNLYMSIDGGAESSVASGATTDLTGQLFIGARAAAQHANIRVGEFKLWNEDRVSTLAADIAYFTAKWLPAAPTGGTHTMGYRAF